MFDAARRAGNCSEPRSGKKRIVTAAAAALAVAAALMWQWLFGWGSIGVIDFSAADVEAVEISCTHTPGRGTIRDPGEIQALIDEVNTMQNRGSTVKRLLRGIGMGGGILYDYDFHLKDGSAFFLTFCQDTAAAPGAERSLSYWYRTSPTGDQHNGTMCRGSLETYCGLFEKYCGCRPAG